MMFMHRRSLLTVALLLLCTGLSSSITRAPQQQDRVVDKLSFRREPVKIKQIKTKHRKAQIGETFAEDDQWLEGFTVTVDNNSGKTITSLRVDLTFLRPPNHEAAREPAFSHSLRFNPDPFFPEYGLRDKSKSMKPGESIDLSLPGEEYQQIKVFLRELKYPQSIERIELTVVTVGFEDGTIWHAGTIFYRDPDEPGKFIKERPRAEREIALLIF